MSESVQASGINGQLEVLEDKIRISRKGMRAFMTQGLKGDKEIRIDHISSIQFKPAGLVTNGYIQFAFMGGREAKGGVMQATRDENTVMFNKKQQPSFEAVKQAIESRRNAPTAAATSSSSLDELEKLASLRDRGIITEEEFAAKKKELLGL